MQKIIPHLWFDQEAVEAANFYVSIFENGSNLINTETIHDTPSGDCDIVTFDLQDYRFMAISAGPLFKFNPSVSFLLNFDPAKDKNAREKLDAYWERLSSQGSVLMELDTYPFSERYGWLQDKYGVSWQLILSDKQGEARPFITPFLMFIGSNCGKAEDAINYYCSLFKNSKRGRTAYYPSGSAPDKEGSVMFADFQIEDQWFAAIDSAHKHPFAFNEAISFIVNCKNQKEIDYYWEKLSAVQESEQCGWLKDKYGLSWQIVPDILQELMSGDEQKKAKVTQAFLKMKKFDIAELERAAKT
ncbi:MAG TPA: VOC family protein [Gammaproteobacteria bacterium]|nr:VOC family protein [Gammaproteobacteria bacterium]